MKSAVFFPEWCRYYAQSKKKQVYKTLNYQVNTARSQATEQRFLSAIPTDLTDSNIGAQEMPKYSIYVEDGEFHQDVSGHTNSTAVRS